MMISLLYVLLSLDEQNIYQIDLHTMSFIFQTIYKDVTCLVNGGCNFKLTELHKMSVFTVSLKACAAI